MARTDIHTPTNLVPQDYTCTGMFYADMTWNLAWGPNPLEPFDTQSVPPVYESAYKCDVCGAAYRWGAVFEHTSGVYITMGQICATKHALSLSEHPKRFRKRALIAIKRQKASAAAWSKCRAMLRRHQDLSRLLRVNNHIVTDIRTRFLTWGRITERQLELLRRIAARVTEEADRVYTTVPINSDRVTVTGTVLSTKYVTNTYGYGPSSTLKMLVLVHTPQGYYKLWGTCPSKLERLPGDLKGRQITFTAMLERSGDDPTFGFFKRPAKVVAK